MPARTTVLKASRLPRGDVDLATTLRQLFLLTLRNGLEIPVRKIEGVGGKRCAPIIGQARNNPVSHARLHDSTRITCALTLKKLPTFCRRTGGSLKEKMQAHQVKQLAGRGTL